MYISVSQRFIEAVEYLIDCHRLRNQAELTLQLNLSKGYVSQIVTGKREPSEQIVRKFANLYPEINLHWIMSGEGEMLSSPTKNSQIIGNNSGTAINGDNAVVRPAEESATFQRMQTQIDTLIAQNGKLLNIIENLTKQ